MTNWKSYLDDFYKKDAEQQSQAWSRLTSEQKVAFLATYNGSELSDSWPQPPVATIGDELDRLIHIGEEFLSNINEFRTMLGVQKNGHEFEAWRLECIGLLRTLGSPAEHLLAVAVDKKNSFFFKNPVRQILGSIVAARTLTKLDQYPKQGYKTSKERQLPATTDKSVFVAHGHDHSLLQQAARLLEQLGLAPRILFEESSRGRTTIEKLEQHTACSAALVILTPDDVGTSASCPEELMPRARQNVILELGYLLGMLGRNRVVVLYTEGVELPSDYAGVEYIKFDPEGAWRLRIARELRAAGLVIDFNALT